MTETNQTTPAGPPDITPIRRLIRTTAALLRSSWVATGLGLSFGLLAAALVSTALLDLALPLGTALRAVALGLIVVPAAWAFFAGVVRPAFRGLGDRQVARRIEGHIPGIHNRLVSCIDLDSGGARADRSPAFYGRLVREALDRVKAFRPVTVVDLRSLRRAGAFAAASLTALVVATLLFSEGLPTALARIFSPFADIPPATGVRFVVEPGDAKVLRGEDVGFVAKVTKGNPESLRLEVLPAGGGAAIWHDLKHAPGDPSWTLMLSASETPFTYRVHGGGTWSKLFKVGIVERPKIVGLHTVLHYPPYMGLAEPRVGPPQVADVTGPEASAVEVVVKAEGDVAEGEIQLLSPRSSQVEVTERPERGWFQERTPEGAGLDGNWQWDMRLLARPAHTEPPNPGVHGHLFVNAPVPFRVRKGENLYAYVWIKPDQKPETIMLQWHDGAGWEHRAFWGEDKIPAGLPDTPSRRKMGPLPTAGEWVRLEVPAEAVDLAGKSVRGMAFTLFGGQCFWHRAGALPSARTERQDLVVVARHPLQSAGQASWSGRFPLEHDGLYRVELRNQLKHANQAMRQAKVTAIPDNPPQVVLERPGTDLVLSEPAKVPLVIAASDDFGLADVVVSAQIGDSGGFIGRPVRKYDIPKRSDNLVATLDLPALGVTVGQHVRYRIEARDRKGQTAQTQEYLVRIAADNNASDKVLAELDKKEDTFRENLVKLIAEQAKVRDTVAALEAKYTPLEEKIKKAEAEAIAAQPRPDATVPKVADPANDPANKPPKLNPEDAKTLAELRAEIAKLAALEEQNANLGKQVTDDLAKAAEQAAANQMVPPQMADAMREVPRDLQVKAVDPMRALANQMKQAADANKAAPDLDDMKRQGDHLMAELEAAKAKLDALDHARDNLKVDPDKALVDLNRDLMKDRADDAARDMKDLSEFLKQMAAELERLKNNQVELADAADKVPDVMLPDVDKRQDKFEQDQADPKLDEARDLLKTNPARKPKRDPEFPDAPYVPDQGEEMVPPKESDTDEPDAKDKDKKGDPKDAKDKADQDKADEDKEEDLFQPALGGPKPKLDPRFADKVRPEPEKSATKDGNDPPKPQRKELGDRQRHKLGELSTAKQSVDSDRKTLADLMRDLQAAKDAQDQDAADQISKMLQSKTMNQARSMASRMKQMGKPGHQAGQSRPGPSQPPQPGQVADASAQRTDAGTLSPAMVLRELDPGTRAAILKLQPKLREELLQGLREEGPEGYRTFIRDYFGRLTKVKGAQ